VLLAIVVLALTPTPSQVFTVTLSTDDDGKVDGRLGSIVVSASALPGSQIFEDEKEVLASITTENRYDYVILTLQMTTISSIN